MLDPGGLFILILEIFTPISPSSISPSLSPLLSLLATTLLFSVYKSAEGSTSKLLHRKVAEDRHGFSQSEGSQRQSEQGGGTRRGGECLLE